MDAPGMPVIGDGRVVMNLMVLAIKVELHRCFDFYWGNKNQVRCIRFTGKYLKESSGLFVVIKETRSWICPES